MRSRSGRTGHPRSGEAPGGDRRIVSLHGGRVIRPLLVGLAALASTPAFAAPDALKLELTVSNLTDRGVEVRFTGAACTLRSNTVYRLEEAGRQSGLLLTYYDYRLPTTTPEQALFGGSKEGVVMKPAQALPELGGTCKVAHQGCPDKSVVQLGPSAGQPGDKVLVAFPAAIGLTDEALELGKEHVLVEPEDGRRPRLRAACPVVRLDPGLADARVVLTKEAPRAEPELGESKVSVAGVAVPFDRHLVVATRGESRIDVYLHPERPFHAAVTLMGRRSRDCLARAGARAVSKDCDAGPLLDLVPVTGDHPQIRDAKSKRCLAAPAARRGRTPSLVWTACRAQDTAQHWRALDEVNEAGTKVSQMYDHLRSEATGLCLSSVRGKAPNLEPCDPSDAMQQWKAVEK